MGYGRHQSVRREFCSCLQDTGLQARRLPEAPGQLTYLAAAQFPGSALLYLHASSCAFPPANRGVNMSLCMCVYM